MADGAAKLLVRGLVPCQTSDMQMGRTCSLDGHQLIIEICFYLLDTAELIQRARDVFDAALARHRHCKKCLAQVREVTRDSSHGGNGITDLEGSHDDHCEDLRRENGKRGGCKMFDSIQKQSCEVL